MKKPQVIVDTNVWIDDINGKQTALTRRLGEVERFSDLLTFGLVAYEVAVMERPSERPRIRRVLNSRCREINACTVEVGLMVAEMQRELKHVTNPSLVDWCIAAFAILKKVEVLSQDRFFETVAEHYPLILVPV